MIRFMLSNALVVDSDYRLVLCIVELGVGYSPRQESLSYTFTYIAHPRSVTGFSWRKSSKYMPRYDQTRCLTIGSKVACGLAECVIEF